MSHAYLAMQQSQKHSVLFLKGKMTMNHVKTLADQFQEHSLKKCHALVYEFGLINDFTMYDLGLLMLAIIV